jgi:hypothetical protein
VRHSRLSIAICLSIAVWPASVTPSRSCGFEDPGGVNTSRGVLNWIYPNALYVTSAVWKAQLDGVIAKSRPPDQRVRSLLGGYAEAARVLRRFGQNISEFQTVSSQPSISLVLLGPVLWTRYAASENGYTTEIHAKGASAGDVVLVTDEPVVEALVEGRLTADTAEKRGLIRFYGRQPDIVTVRSFLLQAYKVSVRKSDPSSEGKL